MPRPGAIGRHSLNVGRSVGRLGQDPAGVIDQVRGPLAVLANGLSQPIKVGQGKVRQSLHLWGGLGGWQMQPRYKPLKVALSRCHIPPCIVLLPTHYVNWS
ncbi:protein of unknown function [Denitratisoma oestradiolicum]|uniref:Uncharacterized protein n=1 Tax=Denitratisoma oestradiolicum TaxID=311182 RepID=A0A6S6Y1K1_9PROT|nr:protein of unknown function [Denitratisoma oestradiolicum]